MIKTCTILAACLFYCSLTSASEYPIHDNKSNFVVAKGVVGQLTPRDQLTTSYPRKIRTIASVYDGDTVRFGNGQRVRLLGISAPEIKSQYRAGQAGGIAAKKWLHQKLAGQKVLVEYDQQQVDKYQRQLAHLFLPDGEHINAAIIKTGLVSSLIIPPNIRYADNLIEAEKQAELNHKGIWAMPAYQTKTLDQLVAQKKPLGWQRYKVMAKSLKHSKKYSRLIVSDKVDIRIPKQSLSLFPELDHYLGREIEVRGWASRRKGHYSILIRHPSAIVLH